MLTDGPPTDASAYGDKVFDSKDDEAGIPADTVARAAPLRQANMRPNLWADKPTLRRRRSRIEATNSRLEAMGSQRPHARAIPGCVLKVQASPVALTVVNATGQSR